MTSPLVILQARTGSRRLPGKALLDFHGWPLAVLAAKRAANAGARVVLATSDDPSDDALADTATRHGIPLVRGSLDNVLARFILALGAEPDAAPVIRLTGDNILPDGALIAEVVADFEARGLDYLSTTDPATGLPYGCSLEVTRAGHLRQAAREAQTAHDREHVTPLIRARFGLELFTRHAALGCGHLRSTIDCLDDYDTLYHATPRNEDLVHLPWQKWLETLSATRPRAYPGASEMVLGTAQIGMTYGIARHGSPDVPESLGMIRAAIAAGVGWVDTAHAYGDSEHRIGQVLARGWDGRARVVTKLSPLADLAPDTPVSEVRYAAENSLLHSCLALGGLPPDTVLLHRCAHLDAWDGAVADTLRDWRDSGRIRAMGVSVQSPQELARALGHPDVAHIQIPCNILDHRWDGMQDAIRTARAERGLVMHVRSALLQGLLTSEDPALWRRAHVTDPAPVIRWLDAMALDLGYADRITFCLAWARGLDWADGVVVGCDGLTQLHDTLARFDAPSLEAARIGQLAAQRPMLSDRSLDPAQWLSAADTEQTR